MTPVKRTPHAVYDTKYHLVWIPKDRGKRTPSVKVLKQALIEVLKGAEESKSHLRDSLWKGFCGWRIGLPIVVLGVIIGGFITYALLLKHERIPVPVIPRQTSLSDSLQGPQLFQGSGADAITRYNKAASGLDLLRKG